REKSPRINFAAFPLLSLCLRRRAVVACHGDVDALTQPRLNGIRRAVDGFTHDGQFVRAEILQYVGGGVHTSRWPADADPQPGEVLTAKPLDDVPHALLPARAAERA